MSDEQQPASQPDPMQGPLAALARRLRGNPGRVAVIVASLDAGDDSPWAPGGPPSTLATEVRRRVEERVGPEVRVRLEHGAPAAEAMRGLLGLLEPDRDERRALADELMEAAPTTPGEQALAALCLGEVVRAVLVPTGCAGGLTRTLHAHARPPRRVDLHDDEAAAAAASSSARWLELATIDAPWLAEPDDDDEGLGERLATWLERTAPGGVLVVGHDGADDPLLAALIARGPELPLGVAWLGGGAGPGREALEAALEQPLLDVPTPSPGRALAELRARLGVAPLGAARQPLARRILDTSIEPPIIVARVPLLSGYADLVEGVPSFTVRAVLLTLLAALAVLAAGNAAVAWRFVEHLDDVRAEVKAIEDVLSRGLDSTPATTDEGEVAAEARDRAHERRLTAVVATLDDPDLAPSGPLIPGPLTEALAARATALRDEVLHLDDHVADAALYRHGLRARLRFDRVYGTFGRFPEPDLEPLGRGGRGGDRVRFGAALALHRAVVVAPRDLLLDVLLLRAVDRVAFGEAGDGDDLRRFVVMVSLRDYEDGELLDLVAAEVERVARLEPGDLSRALLLERLEDGDITVLFANVDSARRAERAVHRVARFAEEHPGASVIAAMQDDRFARALPGFACFAVSPFTRAAVRGWLEETGLGDLARALRERPRLLEDACDPLLLSLLCRTWKARGRLPSSRTRLFEAYLDDALRELTAAPSPATPGAPEPLPPGIAARTLLSAVAGPLVFQASSVVSRDDAVESLARLLKDVPELTLNPRLICHFGPPAPRDHRRAEALLERLLATGLLAPVRGDSVRFASPELEAAFRARAIMTRARRGTWQLTASPVDAGAVLGLFPDERRLRDAIARVRQYEPGLPPDPEPLVAAADMLGIGDPLDPVLEARLVEGLTALLCGPWEAAARRAQEGLVRLDRAATALRLVRELSGAQRAPEVRERVLTTLGALAHPAAAEPLLTLAAAPEASRADRGRLLRAAAECSTSKAVVAAVLSATVPGAPTEPEAARALGLLLAQDAPVPLQAVRARLVADPVGHAPAARHLARVRAPDDDGEDGELTALNVARAWISDAELAAVHLDAAALIPAEEAVVGLVASFGADLLDRLRLDVTSDPRQQLRPLALAVGRSYGGDEVLDVGTLEGLAIGSAPANGGTASAQARALRALLLARGDLEGAVLDVDALFAAPGEHEAALLRALLAVQVRVQTVAETEAEDGPELVVTWLGSAVTAPARLALAGALAQAPLAAHRDVARRALLALLDDASARGPALALLAAFPHPETETALLRRVDGPERWAALEALAAVWRRSDLGPLRAALLDEPAHDAERLRVALALGGTRRADALEPLVAFFQREHPDAWRAADALGRLGDPRAADALTSALPGDVHGAPAERSLALLRALAAVLRGTGQQPSIDWTAWLTHPDPRVASAAYDLLLATSQESRRR